MLASALLDSLPVPAVYPVLVLVFRGAKCYRTTQDKIDRVDGTRFSGVQVVFSPSPRLFAPFGFGRCLHLAGWQLPRFRLETGLEGGGYCSLQVSPFVFGSCCSALEVESHDPGFTQSGK